MDLSLLIQLAPEIIRLTRTGIQQLLEEGPVAEAISATDSALRDVESAPALRLWCESDEFITLFREFEGGSEPPTGDDVVESFVRVGGFFFGDEHQTREKAREVLDAFFPTLHKKLLGGPGGLVYLDARTQRAIREGTEEIRQSLGEIGLGGALTPTASAERASAEGPDQQLQIKVDLARDLIDQGKVVTAQDILLQVREDAQDKQPSEDLLFRIAVNLGACLLALGRVDESERQYRLALELRPEDVRVLALLARTALQREDLDEALDLSSTALKQKLRDSHAAASHLLVLHRLDREEELERFVENNRWLLADPVGAGTLGEIRLEQGHFKDAEELFRRTLVGPSVDIPTVRGMLAVSIVTPVQAILKKNPPVDGLPDELDRSLAQAELELTRAIDAYRNQEVPARRLDAIASRAGVRAMRGKLEAALEDTGVVLAEDADHGVALLNKALVLVRLDRFTEASLVLEMLSAKKPNDVGLQLLLGVALAGSNQHNEAIQHLRTVWDPGSEDIVHLEIADVLLRSAWKLRDQSLVETLIEEIRASAAPPHLIKAVIARQLIRQDDVEAAVRLLEEAFREAQEQDKDRVQRELAEAYFLAERFSDAARIYSDSVDTSRDSASLRTYLASLFNAGNYRLALDIAQRIRRGGKAIPVISEVEARVLQVIGDLSSAIRLFLELAEDEPGKPGHVLEAAGMRIRQGNTEPARELIRSLSFEYVRNDPLALLRLAELQLVLEEPGVLELAYRARRLDFDNPYTHERYVFLFLNSEVLEQESTDEVKKDTGVRLRRGEESRLITIVDDDLTSRARNEVTSGDALAQRLLGKRVGDQAVLRGLQEGLEELEYEIVEIQSKFVSAFQETLMNFSTWFPEQRELQRVEIRENDFSRVFSAVDARHELAQQVTALYRTKPATIGALASLLGTSPIDVWVGLVGLEETRFIVADGAAGEVAEAAARISTEERVVLDLTSVLTLAHLGLLDRLKDRFQSVVCPQSLIDAFMEYLEVNYKGATPSGILAKRGASYVHVEHSEEQLEKGRNHLEEILRFLYDNASVEAVREALGLEPGDLRKLGDLIGHDSLDSLLLAKQHQSLLYADDLRLRQLAKGEYGVDGVWTQPLLFDLREKDLITEDEKKQAFSDLLLSNYVFTSVSANDLLHLLEAEAFARSPRTERVLARALGPETRLNSAVIAAAGIIKGVWLENLLDARKTVILDLVLESLMNGRSGRRRVLQDLGTPLRAEFRLLPIELDEVLNNIRAWAEGHSI